VREKKRAKGTLSPVILTSSCLSCVVMAHCFLMFNQISYCVFVYLSPFYRKYCLNLNRLSREFGDASPDVFFPKKKTSSGFLNCFPKCLTGDSPRYRPITARRPQKGRTVKLTASRPIKTYLLL
jgi:hypothetical protein